MIKIFVDKNETVDSLMEKVGSIQDEAVILVIPRGAAITESATAFRAIKKEFTTAGKSVAIESVDEEVLSLAAKNDIKASHPLFKQSVAQPLSDIVPHDRKPLARKGKIGKRHKLEEIEEPEEEHEALGKSFTAASTLSFEGKKINPLDLERRVEREAASGSGFRISRRPVYIVLSGLLLILVALTVWAKVFGKVQVAVAFKNSPWKYEHAVSASKGVSAVNAEQFILPGELFSSTKNIIETFPATGRRQSVAVKGTGVITIYNAYSAASQSLVATTRFETPDGKIFRIDKSVVVPGAKVEGSSITPASVEVSITADQPGIGYNVSSSRLTIPGFKGTPKFEKFYGVITEPVKGGFVGERITPTQDDITKGKEKVSAMLKNVFEGNILDPFPENFKILKEASSISISKLEAGKAADDQGNFTVFGEVAVKAMGFRESDLVQVLEAVNAKDNPGKKFRDLRVAYENIKPNFEKGEVTFLVKAEGTIEPLFDAESFKAKMSGRKIRDVKKELSELPELAEADVSFWPYWLFKVPGDLERVTITVK